MNMEESQCQRVTCHVTLKERQKRYNPNHSTKLVKTFRQESNMIRFSFVRNHAGYRMKDSLRGTRVNAGIPVRVTFGAFLVRGGSILE